MQRNTYRSRRHRNAHAHGERNRQEPFFANRFPVNGQAKSGSTFFQTKLTVGQPNDKYEREADSVADKVVSNDTNTKPGIQRMCAECEEEKMGNVQKKADASASTSLSSRISNTRGKGNGLPSQTLRHMNASFGVDFSGVKIHTDDAAVRMNKELRAQAFTHGRDIYFNAGRYNPESPTGKHLLAHELTHVVQQGGGQGARDSVQRSCHDGACASCAGGQRDFWVTFYFRRKATRKTMDYLRQQINETKRILKNCCLTFKADFNWTLLRGGGTFSPFNNDPGGGWTYSADAATLGTGNTFAGSRGLPVLVVDHVEESGGGVTVAGKFDATYSGRNYAVIGVNQQNPNPNCTHLAHELWHVGNTVSHDPAFGSLAACQGSDVSPEFCTGLRNVVAPVGDFPIPTGDTAVA